MNAVAVTGASGFIGKHVAAAFKEVSPTVRAFTRGTVSPGLIRMDYSNTDSVARALEGVEVVIHVAGLAHVSSKLLPDPSARYRESNVDVAVNMIEASIRAGVRQFILLSSAGVLGQESPAGGFHDSSPPMPHDAYTMSKYEAEQRTLEIARGKIALAILRPPMVYGPGAPGSYRRLCAWIDRGLPLPLGRIIARRSFVGIRNLCDLLVRISASTHDVSQSIATVLVSDSEPLTVADFAKKIAHVRGKRARMLPVPARLLEKALKMAGLQEEYRRLALPFELAPSRAHEIYNWRPPHSTTEELRWAMER